MLWQYDKIAHDLGQFSVTGILEAEFDFAFADGDGFLHVLEIARIEWAVGLQDAEGPNDVIDGDWLSIMPFRPGSSL